jgi:DnaK suppressor protein
VTAGDALRDAAARAASAIEDLERELAGVEEATAAGPDDEHDAEGSTIGLERARVTALLEQARAGAAELAAAVDRLASGTYGRCEACGRALAAERLEALPAARRCVGCAAR